MLGVWCYVGAPVIGLRTWRRGCRSQRLRQAWKIWCRRAVAVAEQAILVFEQVRRAILCHAVLLAAARRDLSESFAVRLEVQRRVDSRASEARRNDEAHFGQPDRTVALCGAQRGCCSLFTPGL